MDVCCLPRSKCIIFSSKKYWGVGDAEKLGARVHVCCDTFVRGTFTFKLALSSAAG